MSHYISIQPYPYEDENGNREWRVDKCDRACIKANRETHTPEICDLYVQRLDKAFCWRGEEWT